MTALIKFVFQNRHTEKVNKIGTGQLASFLCIDPVLSVSPCPLLVDNAKEKYDNDYNCHNFHVTGLGSTIRNSYRLGSEDLLFLIEVSIVRGQYLLSYSHRLKHYLLRLFSDSNSVYGTDITSHTFV